MITGIIQNHPLHREAYILCVGHFIRGNLLEASFFVCVFHAASNIPVCVWVCVWVSRGLSWEGVRRHEVCRSSGDSSKLLLFRSNMGVRLYNRACSGPRHPWAAANQTFRVRRCSFVVWTRSCCIDVLIIPALAVFVHTGPRCLKLISSFDSAAGG